MQGRTQTERNREEESKAESERERERELERTIGKNRKSDKVTEKERDRDRETVLSRSIQALTERYYTHELRGATHGFFDHICKFSESWAKCTKKLFPNSVVAFIQVYKHKAV